MARRRRVTSWSNNSVMQFPTHILHRDRERERERERETVLLSMPSRARRADITWDLRQGGLELLQRYI